MLNRLGEVGDGFNPFSYSSYRQSSLTTSTSNVLIVNITGAGLLTSISQAIYFGSDIYENYGFVTVIIDGVTKISDGVFSWCNTIGGWTDSSNGNYLNSTFIGGMFKFNSSLQIYHRSSSTGNYAQTNITYSLE